MNQLDSRQRPGQDQDLPTETADQSKSAPIGRSEKPGVFVLLCPGPRFGGPRTARFVRTASRLCRVRPHVVLDMSEVATVDAAGLLAIASLARVCRSGGGSVRLCSPNRAVRKLLATTGVHQLADAYQTRRHASFV
jgi:anti-anti-sigma factor